MEITNTQYANHTGLVQRNTLSADANKSTAVGQPKMAETDTVSISDAGRNAEVKWQEISQKYDVKNISGNEVLNMAKELYDNNLISEEDSLLMYVPLSLDENLNEKSNYLDLMTLSLEMTKKSGQITEQGLKLSEKRIDILEQMSKLFIRS